VECLAKLIHLTFSEVPANVGIVDSFCQVEQSTGISVNPVRKVREFLYEGQMTKAADVEDYKKFCCTGDQLLILFADEASNVVWADLTYFLNRGSAALSYSEQRSYRADFEVKIE
jgi:hypothetical protein